MKSVSQLGCGGCGNETVKVFEPSDKDNKTILFLECTECKSITEVKITTPEIKLNWCEEGSGEGILARK